MWPLSPNQKTAFIFYLAFAGLLIFVSFWSPANPATSDRTYSGQLELKDGLNDLSDIQSSFEVLWKETLNQKGWKQEGSLLHAESKLEEGKFGKVRVKWVNANSKILLPKTITEKDLVELIDDWEKINRSLELNSAKVKWGYQKNQLWLMLSNELTVNTPGGPNTLPIHQLTLVTPSGTGLNQKWPGLIRRVPLPRIPPHIRPEVEVELPKEIPVIKKTRVALIIDDVGTVRRPADAMLEVPARLTWAVLPFTPYAEEYIQAAKERGFEIILHLPMEPIDRRNNPGPGVIKGEWTETEIIEQLEVNLNQVPGAVGVNNHMGSAGTADERLMDIILKYIKDKNIFFVDSMTSDRSVGEVVARRHQVSFNKRDVFIDNQEDIKSKKRALRELMKIALKKGEAIGIGHVRDGTAEAIIEMLPEFEKAGIEIVPVSELIDRSGL